MNYSPMHDKTRIRNQLKYVRDALPFKERREKDYHITTHLRKFLQPYQTVFAYVSKDSEVESFVIINNLLDDGKKVIVPIIQTDTKTLRLSYLKRIEDLKPGTFHVPEPLFPGIPVSAETIEIAILPLVGFDRSGNRLGYGAGYYDRFFETYPDIPRIGLAYACQEVPVIPTDPFDRKMNWIVTENGFIACNSARSMF
jgi:5-formyltetrahydrofolate cyclo-ligase